MCDKHLLQKADLMLHSAALAAPEAAPKWFWSITSLLVRNFFGDTCGHTKCFDIAALYTWGRSTGQYYEPSVAPHTTWYRSRRVLLSHFIRVSEREDSALCFLYCPVFVYAYFFASVFCSNHQDDAFSEGAMPHMLIFLFWCSRPVYM